MFTSVWTAIGLSLPNPAGKFVTDTGTTPPPACVNGDGAASVGTGATTAVGTGETTAVGISIAKGTIGITASRSIMPISRLLKPLRGEFRDPFWVVNIIRIDNVDINHTFHRVLSRRLLPVRPQRGLLSQTQTVSGQYRAESKVNLILEKIPRLRHLLAWQPLTTTFE